MTMTAFLRRSIWDMVLVATMVFACATAVFSGFYVPEEVAGAYWATAALAAALTVLMMLASYSRRTVFLGIGGLAAVFLGMVIWSAAGSGNAFADTEANPMMRFILLILTAAVVFTVSRFRIGAILLLPAGVIMLSMIEFMYESRHIVCLFLFLICASAMIIYRNYMSNILHSRTLKVAQSSAVVYSLALCAAVALLGTGIFYGIVQPLHPPARELKVITKVMSVEVLEKIGVADEELIEDPDLTTDRMEDRQDTADQDTEEKDENLPEESASADDAADDGSSQDELDIREDGPFSAVRYDWGLPQWLLLIALVLAAIAFAILLKRYLRRRWLAKVKEKPPEEQVRVMYRFFLRKFAQLKLRPVRGETPSGFAARTEDQLALFRTGGVGFPELTEAVVRLEYAGQRPTAEDLSAFETFYGCFYRNLRQYLGKVQYIIRFFIL